jgi:hypothetical protein
MLSVYGHGRPGLDETVTSSASNVTLLADDVIPLDHLYLFEVPALPPEFRSARGRGAISVTLAYDPPTRHTRYRDYLGTRMQFGLYRNADPTAVYDAIRAWSATASQDLEDDVPALSGLTKVSLDPGVRLRNKGTLQKATEVVAGTRWQYDGEPLTLAVICRRIWAPATVDSQRFAVVVSIEHEDPAVDLYAHLVQTTTIYQQARVRVRG